MQLLLRSLNGQTEELPATTIKASVLDCADGALDAFRCIAGVNLLPGINGSALLTERAKLLGFSNPRQVSANGTCRLMRTETGWIALNLAREEDWELVPAWLQAQVDAGDWQSIAALIRPRCCVELIDRGRIMGLPVTILDSYHAEHWYSVQRKGKPAGSRRSSPLVIDLSSLWAGPLCSHLLLHAGATVIKVESSTRPDSTRLTAPEFHHVINSGKYSVMLDLKDAQDISRLAELLRRADIVIESARPRGLRQMGISAEDLVDHIPGLTWMSITGYGRKEPEANWVAFGDDAAIAAGAAVVTDDGPGFIGDAVSDPLTGIHAAIAALAGWQSGVGGLVDISLAAVTSFIMKVSGLASVIDLESGTMPRAAESTAPPLGHNTNQVFKEFVDP
jgi:hypothetical protein